jgi:hypothetical protein
MGQRGDGEQRNGNGQQGVGQVELIVMEIGGVIGFLVLLGLRFQLVFLFGLLGRQLLVLRDRLLVIRLFGRGLGRGGQPQLQQCAFATSSRMLRAW